MCRRPWERQPWAGLARMPSANLPPVGMGRRAWPPARPLSIAIILAAGYSVCRASSVATRASARLAVLALGRLVTLTETRSELPRPWAAPHRACLPQRLLLLPSWCRPSGPSRLQKQAGVGCTHPVQTRVAQGTQAASPCCTHAAFTGLRPRPLFNCLTRCLQGQRVVWVQLRPEVLGDGASSSPSGLLPSSSPPGHGVGDPGFILQTASPVHSSCART